MLKTLSDATTKFVSENKNLPIENTTDCLSTMASVCRVMLETLLLQHGFNLLGGSLIIQMFCCVPESTEKTFYTVRRLVLKNLDTAFHLSRKRNRKGETLSFHLTFILKTVNT